MLYNSLADISSDDIFLNIQDFIGGIQLFSKIESLNFAGSVKLKAALAMVIQFEASGILKPGYQVIESSSGNLGVALSMICAGRGYSFTCVTDPNTSPQNISLMNAYGAKVIVVNHAENGGFVKERLRVINKLLAENEDMVWTDQYSNQANSQAHYQTTAPSILQHVPDIDYLFLGVGSSGTFMGCCRYFKEHKPSVKIIAVEPQGSVLFGNESKRRFVPGIGGSVHPTIFDASQADDFVIVSEKDTLQMCQDMVKKRGWLVGGSTGTSLAAVKQYSPYISEGSTVVTLAPDFGINYLDTIYNSNWVDEVHSHIDARSIDSEISADLALA
jgi:2,3-diaminopropionate biosynthesis protein SbnA